MSVIKIQRYWAKFWLDGWISLNVFSTSAFYCFSGCLLIKFTQFLLIYCVNSITIYNTIELNIYF